jgi:exodeoxyribonuclease VII large subunit
VLSRGFALVRDGGGRPLRTAAAVRPGMALAIEFADGRVGAVADGADKASQPAASTKPATAKSRTPGGGGQGSLFG